MKILTAAEMARADLASVEADIPMAALMHSAGSAVARFVLTQYPGAHRITALCGTGNNGGDGFVAAKALAEAGRAVAVLLVGDEKKLQGIAADAYSLLDAANIPIFPFDKNQTQGIDALLSGADLLLDAVTGTGFKPPLREEAAALRDRVQQLTVPIVAVDLPTGWDADSREEKIAGAFRCDAVVTFTAPKSAHVFGHLTTAVFGPIIVAPIGSPAEVVASQQNLLWAGTSKRLTEVVRPIDSNKGMYGRVLVVAGSMGKAGAAAMSSLACLRAGAGLVTAAVARDILPTVAAVAPELMCAPLDCDVEGRVTLAALGPLLDMAAKMDVLAVGPGISSQSDVPEFVRRLVAATRVPMVLDADGLNAFAGRAQELNGRERTLVLTPHPGEMARLLGISIKEVEADRIHLTRSFATEHHITLVLKGWRTLIAHPDGTVAVNSSGNPAMAKGGSGDILTGIVAAMLAQYPQSVADAVNAAVYLHGLAGDFAAHAMDERCVLATDTVAHLSDAFRYRSQDEHGFEWIAGLRR